MGPSSSETSCYTCSRTRRLGLCSVAEQTITSEQVGTISAQLSRGLLTRAGIIPSSAKAHSDVLETQP